MGTGPLKGVRIVEVAGIGPGPFAAMLLADLGADVLRVERMEGVAIMRQMGFDASRDVSNRSRSAIAVDLKNPEGVALVLELIDAADAVTEGFRPGVMERLGLGPEVCLARNRRLVYGRMTGWVRPAPWRARRDTTSTTSPSPGYCTLSRAKASGPCRPAMRWVIWVEEGCCLRSASPARCSSRAPRASVKSWMRPCSRVPPPSARALTSPWRWVFMTRAAPERICPTRARTSTRSTKRRIAATWPWERSSRSSRCARARART